MPFANKGRGESAYNGFFRQNTLRAFQDRSSFSSPTGGFTYKPYNSQAQFAPSYFAGLGASKGVGQAVNNAASDASGWVGGDWAGVDQWNDAINQAASQTGVPANLIKSIMRLESGGNPASRSDQDAVGLMQIHIPSWGSGPWETDPAANILKGAQILKSNFDNCGTWEGAVRSYLGGGCHNPNAADSLGTTQDMYWSRINSDWQMLNSNGGGTGNPTGTQTGGVQFNSIWGGTPGNISQGFGWTDFARNSAYARSGAYNYTSEYTRDRQPMGHAGIDVAMNPGTQLYAPIGGTVEVAGGSGYYCDVDGNGCGPGVGELLLRLDNGDVLILGHMRNINVRVGQRVNAGQAVGLSGSENGGHVHVEYRRWVGQGVTNSGYEVLDPQQALGGSFTGTYGGAPTSDSPFAPRLTGYGAPQMSFGSGQFAPRFTGYGSMWT